MEVSVIPAQLYADCGAADCIYIEGAVRIALPLLMHAQSRINREELKPLSLEAVLVAKSEDVFFYSCAPVVLWASSAASEQDSSAAALYGSGSSGKDRGRDNVWSFCSDVSTGNEDHTLDEDFNENDRIFDTAFKAGASYMQFPFRFKIPASLPPTLIAPRTPLVEATCPQCTTLVEQSAETGRTGLVRFPQYEVMAMLSFESFAVSAYQVVSAPLTLTRTIPNVDMRNDIEPVKMEGMIGSGAFRYKLWDAPKYHVLGMSQPYEFKLVLSNGSLDLSKITSVNVRPVFRYRHNSAQEQPTSQSAHLYTPYQNSSTLPPRSISLPSMQGSQSLTVTVPATQMDRISYPNAPNLGNWCLENAIELGITYRAGVGSSSAIPATGSLSRMIKPSHHPHLHHAENGYIAVGDSGSGMRMGFVVIPVTIVQPFIADAGAVINSSGVGGGWDGFGEDTRRLELESLMDRVEKNGVTVEGTVSCLFSAKKLVRMGLKDWVDAGTDAAVSVAAGGRQDDAGSGSSGAVYRSDAKPKHSGGHVVVPAVPMPPSVTPPAPVVANPGPPAVTTAPSASGPSAPSPYIPTRKGSVKSVPMELSASISPTPAPTVLPPPPPASPSIPKRADSTDISALLANAKITMTQFTQQQQQIQQQQQQQQQQKQQQRRESIVQSLDLKEFAPPAPAPVAMPVIPRRTNSQAIRVFIQPKQQPQPQKLQRGMGEARKPFPNPVPNTSNNNNNNNNINNNNNTNNFGYRSLPRPPQPSPPTANASFRFPMQQPAQTLPTIAAGATLYGKSNDRDDLYSPPVDDDDDNIFAFKAPKSQRDEVDSLGAEVGYSGGNVTIGLTVPQQRIRKKSVTFDEKIQLYSALSYANSEDASALGLFTSDATGNPYAPADSLENNSSQGRSNVFLTQPPRRVSLATETVNEVLQTRAETLDIVDNEEDQSMVPGGRGVFDDDEISGGAFGVPGRLQRSGSLPREAPIFQQTPSPLTNPVPGYASLPRNLGASGGLKGYGSNMPMQQQPGMRVGAKAGPPVGGKPLGPPVVIAPRTSSVRWTEDQ
ncbi:hypothetical protein HDU83_001836 [Entophlyctis luteolus]|nr:hypothetical protein HDU83_001836 [Entophlyctis luteolus]